MQDTVNHASWRPAAAPCNVPRGHQVVVRTRAVAINPFDRHRQAIGPLALFAAP